MNFKKRLVSGSMLFFFLITIVMGQEIRFITYNIKNDYQKEGDNNWLGRRDKVISLLKHYEPSVFGVQEALQNQVQFIDESLSNYSYFGVGRDDGKTQGEYCAVFYDSTVFDLLYDSTIWLSETPGVISTGWDAALPRICTYGLLKDKRTNKSFYVLNTHFDHIGELARENSANLIVKYIKEINGEGLSVIIMGDLNASPEDKPIQVFRSAFDDAQEVSLKPFYGPKGTFNGFRDVVMENRIDYFFTSEFTILEYVHIDDRLDNNKHISDHLPVFIKVKLISTK